MLSALLAKVEICTGVHTGPELEKTCSLGQQGDFKKSTQGPGQKEWTTLTDVVDRHGYLWDECPPEVQPAHGNTAGVFVTTTYIGVHFDSHSNKASTYSGRLKCPNLCCQLLRPSMVHWPSRPLVARSGKLT